MNCGYFPFSDASVVRAQRTGALRIKVRLAQWLLALSAVVFVAAAAHAQEAFTTRPANVRAGPDRDYPLITQLPPGFRVQVMGCVADYRWCDVVFNGDRGWMYAGNLAYPYRSNRVPILGYGAVLGLPIITFSLGSYWDQYYHGRPWYPQRDYWRHRAPQFKVAPRHRAIDRPSMERRHAVPPRAIPHRESPRPEAHQRGPRNEAPVVRRPDVRRDVERPASGTRPENRGQRREGGTSPGSAQGRGGVQRDR